MNWAAPRQSEVIRAIDTYVAVAYAGGTVPGAVRARIDTLKASDDEGMYELPVFETDKSTAPPTRFAIRLGNRSYPHMKMIVERSPDERGHLFRADTHDQHVRPKPGSRDADAFTRLVSENQQIAEQIEAAWEHAGLPTFKAYLRQDLARRLAAMSAAGGASGRAP